MFEITEYISLSTLNFEGYFALSSQQLKSQLGTSTK